MPLAARKIIPLHLAAFFVVLTADMAGAPPSQPEGFAPPESFTTEQRSHWAYQPLKRVEPPAVKAASWVRNPIDPLILAGLEEMGWSPAPEADRVALIRRVTFDLTGLPPMPEEVAAFLEDDRPHAYERLVDRLLAS